MSTHRSPALAACWLHLVFEDATLKNLFLLCVAGMEAREAGAQADRALISRRLSIAQEWLQEPFLGIFI